MKYENRREVRFDPTSESVVETIVAAVSSIRDVEPTGLPPLGRSIDLALLERLTDPAVTERVESGHVTFPYADVTVTVDLDGHLRFEWE